MNLPYIYELLAAADAQRHGFIKLRGIQAEHQVRLMAQAGLVEASFGNGEAGSFTSINCVSATGKSFLRAFRDHPIPAAPSDDELMPASPATVVAKWKSRFAVGLLPFRAER